MDEAQRERECLPERRKPINRQNPISQSQNVLRPVDPEESLLEAGPKGAGVWDETMRADPRNKGKQVASLSVDLIDGAGIIRTHVINDQ